jgi:hypothetical protein
LQHKNNNNNWKQVGMENWPHYQYNYYHFRCLNVFPVGRKYLNLKLNFFFSVLKKSEAKCCQLFFHEKLIENNFATFCKSVKEATVFQLKPKQEICVRVLLEFRFVLVGNGKTILLFLLVVRIRAIERGSLYQMTPRRKYSFITLSNDNSSKIQFYHFV